MRVTVLLCFVTCFNYNLYWWPVVSDEFLTVPCPLVHEICCLLGHSTVLCGLLNKEMSSGGATTMGPILEKRGKIDENRERKLGARLLPFTID